MKEKGREKQYYNIYKNNAKKKNLIFELTLEEFKNIIKGVCYYCDHIEKNINNSNCNEINS